MAKQASRTNRFRIPAALVLISVLTAGCATVGRDFNSTGLSWIFAGQTGKGEILEKLGEPFRVGIDSGDPTWTYGYYRYRVFGESLTKDLVIRFDPEGKVRSFTLNTNFPGEKETLEPALGK